ncbi:MAG: polysaccharide biosynthesis protein [Terriglobales bacterium]|jgi:FlaA1/EpsC-like NDP-sugar epimerase
MLFLDKSWWDKFRWHACPPVAVALLFGVAGNPGWASNPETPKPCTSQSASQTSSPSTGQSIRQKEESHSAESPGADPAEKDRPEKKSVAAGFCLAYFAQNLVSDQKTIWTTPLHLHALHGEDKNWLVPFAAGTLGLVAADRDIMRHFGSSPLAHSNSFSNYGLAAMIASAAGLYLRGETTSDDDSRETGFLAGEAAVNSLIVAEAMKLAFRRARPNAPNAGRFGAGGSSFPSEHALAAWSIASVIAHEYPGPLTKLLAYGAASGITDALDVLKAVLTGSLAFLFIVRYGLGLKVFPLSIYALEASITFTLLTGIRILSRMLAETVRRDSTSKRLLLVGAGHAAQMIIRETQEVETGYRVIGCVDDHPLKKGLRVLGVPVLGPVEALAKVVRKQRIDEVLIAIPSATRTERLRLVEICKQASAAFRTVPEMAELIAGQVTLQQVREVSLADLLGRKPIALDLESAREHIRDRVVMVTGAAGSIGSELCRQIRTYEPKLLLCVDQNETGIFHLQHQLTQCGSDERKVFCVADFSNPERMRKLFLRYGVEIVFHAAAYKHVPVMEANVEEAVSNNVFGLLALLNVAQSSNCAAFVMISSDKAVNPTNVMGCTKRVGELILAAWPGERLRSVSVRFGNVLGSNGSVIPLFQEQIRQNQPITITHPEITRFFMTISEAVSLVLQGFAIGRNGDILVLDMGEPVRIAELAKTLVRLSGKSCQEFKFIGLRPGEKLFEELFYPDERVFPSGCEKIAYTESVRLAWPALKHGLDELHVAMSLGKRASILAHLKQIVPQFTYAGSDQAGSMENMPLTPSASKAQPETSALVAMPRSRNRPWPVNPWLGPADSGPGD